MAYDIAADIRLDPRLKALLGAMAMEGAGDVDSRETLLAEANSEEAKQQAELFRGFMDMCDNEEVAPSAGLRVRTETFVSEPDGNRINIQFIRPDSDDACRASITSTAAACSRCRLSTACTAPGARSSPRRAWRSPWSTSATACRRRRRRRWSRSRPGSTTASPA